MASPYDRSEWSYPIDADGDCQNTRHEVLIQESAIPVTFTDEDGCRVKTGEWTDRFTGEVYTNASDLEVDHLVSLKEAHDAGGWQWSREKKRAFANDLDNPHHLNAIARRINRQKGSKGFLAWQAPDQARHCQFVKGSLDIRHQWDLPFEAWEYDRVEEQCPDEGWTRDSGE